jgi:hypothetical protein
MEIGCVAFSPFAPEPILADLLFPTSVACLFTDQRKFKRESDVSTQISREGIEAVFASIRLTLPVVVHTVRQTLHAFNRVD